MHARVRVCVCVCGADRQNNARTHSLTHAHTVARRVKCCAESSEQVLYIKHNKISALGSPLSLSLSAAAALLLPLCLQRAHVLPDRRSRALEIVDSRLRSSSSRQSKFIRGPRSLPQRLCAQAQAVVVSMAKRCARDYDRYTHAHILAQSRSDRVVIVVVVVGALCATNTRPRHTRDSDSVFGRLFHEAHTLFSGLSRTRPRMCVCVCLSTKTAPIHTYEKNTSYPPRLNVLCSRLLANRARAFFGSVHCLCVCVWET